MLAPDDLERMFSAVREHFEVLPQAETTVECAPGTLVPAMLDSLLACGVNRVSLGVQSFVDEESASVGRLHTRHIVLDDIARLRAAGIGNLSIDLIAGLPHQTRESWAYSLQETIATGVPHVSVYMLEVDEDSRLGRELMAGGTRYHAHFVPDDDLTADLYVQACEGLDGAGISQYEISNFARETCRDGSMTRPAGAQPRSSMSGLPAGASLHNLKYWTRQPYLGFGVDAHSMLASAERGDREAMEREITHYLEHAPNFGGVNPQQDTNFYERLGVESVRFATSGVLETYLSEQSPQVTPVSFMQALEESYFLGLRLNRGVRPGELAERFGPEAGTMFREAIAELRGMGLLEVCEGAVRLTARGRLLSNEVFERFVGMELLNRRPRV